MVLSRNGQTNGNGSFDWRDALIDAAIVAALTFVTSMGGISLVGAETVRVVAGAAIAAVTQFFIFLAIKRGLTATPTKTANDGGTPTKKSHRWNKIGLFLGGVFLIWTIWQHEIMMKPYMDTQWTGTFQFFSYIVVNWGVSYDLTLLLIFVAVILELACLWFWTD